MPQAAKIFDALCDNLSADNPVYPLAGRNEVERRGPKRAALAYRPCCISRRGEVFLGMIRNQSPTGAMIEFAGDGEDAGAFAVNDRMVYFWNSEVRVEAIVAWVRDGCIGVANVREISPFERQYPNRSVRIPCAVVARFWCGDRGFNGIIKNISLGGMLVWDIPPLDIGMRLSIKLHNLEVYNAEVAWRGDRCTGIRFTNRILREDLAGFLRGNNACSALFQNH